MLKWYSPAHLERPGKGRPLAVERLLSPAAQRGGPVTSLAQRFFFDVFDALPCRV
ncbi:MAG: hypothetical protein ACI81R_003467 [Bradymonadia bacterium]